MHLRHTHISIALAVAALLAGCLGGGGDTPAAVAATPASTTATPTDYALGGTVAGLSVSGLVLANGTDSMTVAPGSASFRMPAKVAAGAAYNLTVQSQPVGMTCTVANGTASATQADVANVVVTCATDAHRLGGTVAGLSTAGLQLANGADTITVAPGATTFQLAQPVAYGSSYAVTVATQPTGQSCGVVGGSSTMAGQDVANVAVTCSSLPYRLGGTITGLGASGLVLSNGADTYTVAANAGSFQMPGTVAYGATYALAVLTQPTGLTCSVSAGSGTMAAADVANVAVTCAPVTHAVSGSVAGLSASGLVLASGSATIPVASGATTFAVGTPVAEGAAYAVTVQSQPTGLVCSVANGAGTMGTSAVTNVAVTCAPQSYTLGGTISGLTTTGLTLANGSDTLSVAANASTFTMPTSVAFGSAYSIAAAIQPNYLSCIVTNGSGTVGSAAVTNVAVGCAAWQVTTVAGSAGSPGSADGTGSAARFNDPFGIARSASGDFYVTDNSRNTVRRVTPQGVVTTFAGSGTLASVDGSGTSASFSSPAGAAFDAQGNLYVFDLYTAKLRKITPAGVVTTLAGSGSSGSADGTGAAASFSADYNGLTVDSQGNVFVADIGNQRIRKVTPAGVVTTLAGSSTSGGTDGTGSAARFSSPAGLGIDAADNLYVAELGGRIRKVTPSGVVTTIAGNGTNGTADGSGSAARFSYPYAIAVAGNGTLYVADTANNRIRRVTPDGIVSTIAGSSSGNTDGPGNIARLSTPIGLALDAAGALWVAEYGNNTIRKITP